jgi:hypothetical protein
MKKDRVHPKTSEQPMRAAHPAVVLTQMFQAALAHQKFSLPPSRSVSVVRIA